ncbi:MAG TPA: thiamine phosphate synthase [Desulfobacteraceae bacterium]|nr:thiamine phosphate synthase [Desulfobacteraceae bacterium]
MKSFENVRLYCFTAGGLLKGRDPLELVAAQIRGGADVIQLREKDMSKRDKLHLGLQIRDLTKSEGVLFIVNDDLDLALILKADGVHLGQDDIPIGYAREIAGDMIIGVSTHNKSQVKAAVDAGADYIGVGPVFETGTKKDHEPVLGLDFLAEISAECPIPWVAIGGIGLDRIDSVLSAGGRAVAVISDILLSDEVEARCKAVKGRLP